MSLVKSKGNMYPWVTHCHTHLAGECSHRCSYCYVQTGVARISGKYKGPVRFVESEMAVNYGSGKVIFIEHMNDLFAPDVHPEWRKKILFHTRRSPANTYVFQTKNPSRAANDYLDKFTAQSLMGTTLETNRGTEKLSDAPSTMNRAFGLAQFSAHGFKTFVTIEPIIDFDVLAFSEMIALAHPSFVNIGADSKRCGLPEPSGEKVRALIQALGDRGIEIRQKHNLERLLP